MGIVESGKWFSGRRREAIIRADGNMSITDNGAAAAGRSCGTCTLCCRLPDIDEFDKPANAWCRHCVAGAGCTIYADRPSVCRDFLCLWMAGEDLPEAWEPARCHMMVYRQGPQITVLVDPDHPDAWQTEPHASDLRRWAAEADATGGYIIVFVGDHAFKIDA
jgi:hypothetical protein